MKYEDIKEGIYLAVLIVGVLIVSLLMLWIAGDHVIIQRVWWIPLYLTLSGGCVHFLRKRR